MPVLDVFSKRKLPDRVVLSYIFDYVVIIFFIGAFSALDLAEPYKQHFSLNNESLQYPYANPERISAAQAAVICCLFPLVFIIFWTLCIDGLYSHHKPPVKRKRILGSGRWTMADRLWEMNCGILGLGMSVAGSIVVTGALKNATGKPRPDVIARCQPKPGSKNADVFGLVTASICTQTNNAILKDGFKSWPSGHASIAFAGLGFLSFYLAGKLHVLDARGEAWKTIVVLIPFLAASLVAVSRIMDARHHPFDVITGAILGLFVAWASYRQYFPAITDTTKKGRAYPMRTWGTDANEQKMGILNNGDQVGLVADEEEGRKLGYQPSAAALAGVAGGSSSAGGTGMGLMMERTTSSFSNESALLQARKRESQRAAGRKGSGFYSGSEEYSDEAYELQNTVPQLRTQQSTNPYAQPPRGSEDSEDTRWGISRATAAITGDGAGQVGGFEPPVRRTDTGFETTSIGHTPSPGIASPPPKDDRSRRVPVSDTKI